MMQPYDVTVLKQALADMDRIIEALAIQEELSAWLRG